MAIISYILFEDEDAAIRFHQQWFNNQQGNLTEYARLVASYKFPTRFCNEYDPYPHKREGWALLKKRGWWVCPECLRPTKSLPEVADFSVSNYGYNILDKIKSATLGDVL